MMGIDYSTRIARYLVFRIRFMEKSLLPAWKGNLLRGSLGSVLPKICGLKKFDCSTCGLWVDCPYGYLYRARSKGVVLRRIQGMSKPFVLKPPLSRDRVYEPGSELEFSIVLFGDAVRFEKDVLLSVLRLARRGLGARGARARFEVLEILAVNPYRNVEHIVYRDGVFYHSDNYIVFGDIVSKAEELAGKNGLLIKFRTPYRIVSGGEPIEAPDLDVLLKYVSRKFTNIFAQYIYIIPKYDARTLVEKAGETNMVSIELSRIIIKYRGKPEEYYVADIMYEGRLDKRIMTILVFGELSHVGKRASYGHGWYQLIGKGEKADIPRNH